MTVKEKQQYFLRLYEPNHSKLLRYCESILRNPTEAEDVVGDTVLLAYEQLDKLQKEDSFMYFLFGIARNLIRRKKRRKKFLGVFNLEQIKKLHAPVAPSLNENIQLLYQALDRLPLAQKEALILFELSGYSLKETAQIQGCSLSAVKARVARGRQGLSKILSPQQSISV